MLKALKLSAIGRGMVYMVLFTISAMLYLSMFNHVVVFVSMYVLSVIAIATSILSDKTTVKQFISILTLSGAKRKAVVRCLNAYTLVRALPVILAYTTYLITYCGLTYIGLSILLYYLLTVALLSEVVYKVMRG